MPAGQTYRPTRQYYQQYRPTDPNLLGLQLTDETALNTVPWRPTTATYLRYRGRPERAQWPVLSRDVTPLQSADQSLLDLVPWTPPTAAYQRYRGKPQQAQWPVYARTDATTLQLTDQDVSLRPWLQTTAAYLRYTGKPLLGQYRPGDLTPFVPGLPDQDVNLVPVSARMWRPPSRAAFQQFHALPDLLGLQLADQDVNLVPIGVLWQQRKSRAVYQQFTPTDPNEFAGGLPDQDVNLVPVSARMWRPPSRAAFQQYTPLVLLNDQDTTFLPVAITTVYAIRKSRAPYQQATYFDLGGLGLIDQDVNLVPVSARMWRPPLRTPYQQFRPNDPVGLELADQDVRLVPVKAPSSAYLRYRGKQLWLVRTIFPSTTTVIIVVPTLVPPLSTVFLSDGTMVTFTSDNGIRFAVETEDGRRTTQSTQTLSYTENLNP